MGRKMWKRGLSGLCAVLILIGLSPYGLEPAAAGTRILSLDQAKKLAYLQSPYYTRVKNKINLQKIKYQEAVKSIALKQKNMLTFRWSPLLNFKFPQKPDLATQYEWLYKPMQIQMQLSSLGHELKDVKYQTDEQVSTLYVTAYADQEKMDFANERLAQTQDTIERTAWKVKAGEASQSDLDKMETKQKKLTTDVCLLMRQLEQAKEKLGDATGLHMSWGYQLTNPYVKGRLKRNALKELTEYTLDNDQGFFEAKLSARAGMISMELNERLLKSKYNKYMPYIQPYINQARQGQKIDSDAFKTAYDQFLYALDDRWKGNFRILFIKIPKEWLKGDIDGIRYIEDDPYVMYTQVLEYADLKREQESKEKEVRVQVADQFEAQSTAGNALDSLQEAVDGIEEEVDEALLLNREGRCTYEELEAIQDEYEEYQAEMLDSLAEYSSQLYSFDRLTCGGAGKYLQEGSLSVSAAAGGDSYLEQEEGEGAYYTIESRMEDNVFVMRVWLPEDFSVEITDYELWAGDTQIGGRTGINKPLRHLALTIEGEEKVRIRFYREETFVDECSIDPMVSRDSLEIKGEYQIKEKAGKKKVADYSYTVNTASGTAEITINPVTGEGVAYYRMTDQGGKAIYDGALTSIRKPFRYLALAEKDQVNLRIKFFDQNRQELYTGILNPDTMEITVEGE